MFSIYFCGAIKQCKITPCEKVAVVRKVVSSEKKYVQSDAEVSFFRTFMAKFITKTKLFLERPNTSCPYEDKSLILACIKLL